MKKPTLLTAALLALPVVAAAGCAAEEVSNDDECLPGDIDCSTDSLGGGDGKADAFDFKNSPERMGNNLNYRLAELPKKGTRTEPFWKDQYPDAVGRSEPAWADTYWPTIEGSHNIRWMGKNVKSPMEKYDAAFNNAAGCTDYPSKQYGAGAKAEWDRYKQCAGPAAKWQSTTHQGVDKLRDGKDNDNDGVIDDEGPEGDVDGLASWWGTCHAWAPAAMMVPEPLRDVTINGVTFSVGDIKALIQNVFDRTDAIMVGGRCNLKEIKHSVTGSANDECADLNPGALHVVMTNFLGIAQLPLVEDRTANFEIWNQPVVGYEVTKQDLVTAKQANACVGNTGDTWTYNPSAKELYETKMTVEYVTESNQTPTPIGFHNHVRRDRMHYILEVNSVGKIVGGRYCTDSENTHTDFLWAPKGNFSSSNPFVNVAKVKELIAKSVAKDPGGSDGAKVFTATPALAIPDNNKTGISSDIAASGVTGSPALVVSVDITHTYRGDLIVELHKDGRKVKTLHSRTGGSADDLVQSFNLTAAEVGTAPNGTWTLKVSDVAAIDTGTLNKWSVEFR
ncbi:MAG: proprotein convertase P-domain-containing protein [Deltaproteobacteria bacterium]|nr:proprotein convertase P-domain-containing protein [Deltaproteobacteria bacterium]